MQIASLLNVLASSPAVLALNAAAPGGTGADIATAAPNTGSLADALVTQNPAGQFAGLLTGANIKVASLPLDTAVGTDIKTTSTDTTNTPSGDVAPLSQTGSIAIPPIGLYIDQQPVKNVVLTTDDAISDAANAKKLVFENLDKPLPAGNAALANEVDDGKEGKIKLAGLEANKASDPEFAKAFANIVQQGKDKPAVKATIQAKVGEVKTETITNHQTAANEKAALTTALDQPQQVATKIAAKVLGFKQDKINLESDMTAEMSAKLQDLDAHLRTRNYTQIKAASSALPERPVEQVQLKISQAIDTGLNNIKINLHPAELGAVDVNMDVDREGNTQIRIIADRAETLQMLKHDSNHLVKSLSEIGVKTDAGSLQFSLRGDEQNQQNFANAQNDNNNNGQPNQQRAAMVTGNYSRFSNINEQDLILSINNKALNILV